MSVVIFLWIIKCVYKLHPLVPVSPKESFFIVFFIVFKVTVIVFVFLQQITFFEFRLQKYIYFYTARIFFLHKKSDQNSNQKTHILSYILKICRI